MTQPSTPPALCGLHDLRVFGATAESPCPYLPDRQERKIITRLRSGQTRHEHGVLSRAGFRRSHMIAYRPACPACNACVPVRVRAADYAPSASLRRVARRNADLAVHEHAPRAGAADYAVFVRYVTSRHGDGSMADMTYQDYRDMVEESPTDSVMLHVRTADETQTLFGACLADRMDDGLSAVYSFFEPEQSARSLGTFMVLDLIQRARAAGLPFVYLGYWIAESRKMAYKARFRPVEGLGPNGWQVLP